MGVLLFVFRGIIGIISVIGVTPQIQQKASHLSVSIANASFYQGDVAMVSNLADALPEPRIGKMTVLILSILQ
jgi:hypothetical protein